jgi:hypothetical protein
MLWAQTGRVADWSDLLAVWHGMTPDSEGAAGGDYSCVPPPPALLRPADLGLPGSRGLGYRLAARGAAVLPPGSEGRRVTTTLLRSRRPRSAPRARPTVSGAAEVGA